MGSRPSRVLRRAGTSGAVVALPAVPTVGGPIPAGPLVGPAALPGPTRPAAGPNPYIQHVVVVPLENEVLSEVWANGPYERYLAATYGNATNYYAACHPSAPNYLGMFAAVANQCGSDSWANYTNATLAGEFDA